MAGGRKFSARLGLAHSVNAPSGRAARSRASSSMRNASSNNGPTSSNRRCASGVGVSLPLSRANNCRPRLCSAWAISRLTAGCDTNNSLAAPFIEPVSMTARNTSICLSLKRMALSVLSR